MRRDRHSGWRFPRSTMVLLAASTLAGCESQARQDPIYVRSTTDTLVFHDTALSTDRPLNDSLRSSLELADYARSLELTGLIDVVQRPGPFTVFAIPNPSMEALRARDSRLLEPDQLPRLKRTLSYTIVPGAFPDARLRAMLAKARGPIGLHTLYGDVLGVSIDPATNQLLLSDASGRTSRIWLSSMPQSNGTLYVTQSMLDPAPTAPQPKARMAAR